MQFVTQEVPSEVVHKIIVDYTLKIIDDDTKKADVPIIRWGSDPWLSDGYRQPKMFTSSTLN